MDRVNLNGNFMPAKQYFSNNDYQFFHYRDKSTAEVEYHNQDFYEAYFFISGKVTYVIEGRSHRLQAGDVLLIGSRVLHRPSIDVSEPYERVVVWINPAFAVSQSMDGSNLSLCFEAMTHDRYKLIRPAGETAAGLLEALSGLEISCLSGGFGSSTLRKAYLTQLLVFLNRSFLESHETIMHLTTEYSSKINDIMQYINDNLNGDLSLDSLAQIFFISKFHLLREFKKYSGYTIHRYIQQKRLLMARSLLQDGILAMRACSECGFGDYSNFIRAFKKSFGTSPGKYSRKSN